jgi:hypothetical protein
MKVDRRVTWDVINDDATLHALTGAATVGAWTAVAVPSLKDPALILSAVWQDGRVWAFIDKKKAVSSRMMIESVREFHAVLAAAEVQEVHGIRDPKVPARWMEWLGAKKINEVIDGQEVWMWRHG